MNALQSPLAASGANVPGLATRGAIAGGEQSAWLALGALVAAFIGLAWWLFFSPLPRPARAARPTQGVLRARRLVALLMLLSGALFTGGARWDELWHRMYGGFGSDFLWPPHLLIYVALGLNGVFAVLGLSVALRGHGDVRERFRAEPLMGLVGLISAYQVAAIPTDLLWHRLIGPDLTAWSLPHLLLAFTTSSALMAGLALALSTVPARPWRGLGQLKWGEAAALGLVALSVLVLLQIGTTEWEWTTERAATAALDRPGWAYPLIVLLVGTTSAHVVLHATRRIGFATLVALVVLVAHGATVLLDRALLPPGPVLAAHLLIVAPAVVLDGWYGLNQSRAGDWRTFWSGAALYAIVYFVVALPYLAHVVPAIPSSASDRLGSVAIGIPVSLLSALLARDAGRWLSRLGAGANPPTPRVVRPTAHRRVAI